MAGPLRFYNCLSRPLGPFDRVFLMKWYARDPHRAIEGMAELTLEECGAYNLLLDHAYARDGDLPDSDSLLPRMLRCHWRTWKAIKRRLILKEKIRLEGGKIVPNGVQDTLKDASRLSQEQSKRASRRWQESKNRNNYNEAEMPLAAMPIHTHTHKKGLSKDNPKNKPDLDLGLKAWNAMATLRGLPKVQRLTPQRKRSFALRFEELGSAGWADLLNRIRQSRFLCGENDKGWVADFDWVLKPANCQKIMEGKYANREGTSHKSNGLAEAFNAIDSRLAESGGALGSNGQDHSANATPTESDLFGDCGPDGPGKPGDGPGNG